jgi:hypothetical protein
VVSNAIPPEAREIARQRLAESARILLGRDPLPQVAQDQFLSWSTELSKLLCGGGVELNLPRC